MRSWAQVSPSSGPAPPENAGPIWTTDHSVALDLTSLRLLDFSTVQRGLPTIVVAPFAVHDATIADFAPGHSLVERLLVEGIRRLLLIECKSAMSETRFLVIDNYLADLLVAVEELGGRANLVGLCQGGWLSAMFAARFPGKVAKLVLAASPIDLESAGSAIVDAARLTSADVFRALVGSSGGRMLGCNMRASWDMQDPDDALLGSILQVDDDRPEVFERFRDWDRRTVDLPGAYYLQVVEQLFHRNELARGEFMGLGRKLDLKAIRSPFFLLAAPDDDVTPAEQALAVRDLVGAEPGRVRSMIATAPGGHLSLFMGARTLAREWSAIARWLRSRAAGSSPGRAAE
ncbi:alpha/beta fold hydrolase [Microvirga massiliensis]|uniref:alpha/beta fold hydrolase n=1 Tax=Microvirga massiliensis TaxID=1033741 RepID=UPI00164D466D|nr:alpha/beta fold hydrolase [Microvirga massiliensis]